MLNPGKLYDNIVKNSRIRIDIMNKNAITSLAMIYALWQSKRQDLLDLIRPFVLYAVGSTTTLNSEIDILSVCNYMETEFGYQSFQSAVIKRVLTREISSPIERSKKRIIKENKTFRLIGSYSNEIEKFAQKRTECKRASDFVIESLTAYLNDNRACGRKNYTQSETEYILLSFFEKRGSSVLISVEDLRQLTARSNEIDYFIGKFILQKFERQSVTMDYLIQLTKGYFVTTALYLQAENDNITKSSFKNVTFYLDTRLLLAFLGYKTQQENESIQEMVRSLQKSGAKIACFSYNISEVYNILEAYKQSTTSRIRRPTAYTLENFDEHGSSYTHVDAAQKLFERRLLDAQISIVSPQTVLESHHLENKITGLLDEAKLKEIICSIKPNYNLASFADDISAINTISRLREEKYLPYIEKCRAVFVTSNIVLIAATQQLIKSLSWNLGFPLTITGDDLCVLAWLKDFESNSKLPQMRLLKNVLAAISPSKELMDAYFSNLDFLESQGQITSDEAALLRVDIFARKELMEQTQGEKANLNTEVINHIRAKIREQSLASGIKIGQHEAEKKYQAELEARKNAVCRQAEKEVEEKYKKRKKYWNIAARAISILVALCFLVATFYSFSTQWATSIKLFLIAITSIPAIQAILPFFSQNNFLIKTGNRLSQKRQIIETDRLKEKYLSLLEQSAE